MAGTGITISTDEVNQIATHIESLNEELGETLLSCKSKMDNLSNIWEGEAAQLTIANFNEFAQKYFKSYEEIITQYVQFLRVNVSEGYTEVETQNEKLAEAFL